MTKWSKTYTGTPKCPMLSLRTHRIVALPLGFWHIALPNITIIGQCYPWTKPARPPGWQQDPQGGYNAVGRSGRGSVGRSVEWSVCRVCPPLGTGHLQVCSSTRYWLAAGMQLGVLFPQVVWWVGVCNRFVLFFHTAFASSVIQACTILEGCLCQL